MSKPGPSSDPRLYASLRRIESSVLEDRLGEGRFREDKDDNGLTIFIPNWNHRAFLPGALRDALNALEALEAEGFSAEILVIDDASRDGSQKLLRTVQALYNEPRLRTLCLGENLGLTALRNLALGMSRFRYVYLIDADNRFVASNLPLFLRSIRDTGAAMVYGNVVDVQGGEVVGLRSNMPATLRLTRTNYIGTFSVVDAEKILDLGGYARPHPYAPDDWEMVLHLIAEEEEVVFVPVVMGYYHKRELSANRENRPFRKNAKNALRRVYTQSGSRWWDRLRVGRVYHPDVGYVDEW